MCKLSILLIAATIVSAATITWAAEPVTQVNPIQVVDLGLTIGENAKAPVISGLALGGMGQNWATCGDDHLVRIWDGTNGTVKKCFTGHADWVRAVVFSSDGKRLVTAGDDRQVRFWDSETGKLLYSVPTPGQTVNNLTFSPSSRVLAVVGSGKDVWLIDTQEKRIRQTLEAPGEDNRAVTFSPDGSMLAVAGRNGKIRIWNMADEGRPHDIKGHTRRVRAMTFSVDNKTLASAGDGRQVKFWNTKTWQQEGALPERPGNILSLAFCGKSCDCLAVGSTDNLIRVWDVKKPRQLYRLVGHTGSITTLVWNNKNNTLLSGSYDTTVRLWKIRHSSTEGQSNGIAVLQAK